ncbi:MAG: HAD family hydrolase [Pseudoclavibacter sp.]
MTTNQQCQAVLFDLDGVLTPTALVHERAWSQLFERAFAHFGVKRPYTTDDYLRFVDGRPRYAGVAAVLASRGVTLDEGAPTDAPGFSTVCALGNLKNELFTEVLARDGVEAYPGSRALLDALQRRGKPVAVVSSSRNARRVLEAAGLLQRFPVIVDGAYAAEHGLAGKPAPDTYLEAARRLQVDPRHAAVVEDALSGVASGRAGGFGLVVGVDRGAGAAALREHGADVVVTDLAELIEADDELPTPAESSAEQSETGERKHA